MFAFVRRVLAIAFASIFAIAVAGPFACAHQPPAKPRTPPHAQALAATVHIETDSGLGSGIAWDAHTIVTAKHVVWPPEVPTITTQDGQTCTALSAAYSFDKDIAVIHVTGCKLRPLSIADATIGATVWAAGHPLDNRWSISRGIVMAIRDRLQIDSSINPGMSGGPVVNANGELVGMSVSISTRDGMFAGIGWAIQSDDISAVVDSSRG